MLAYPMDEERRAHALSRHPRKAMGLFGSGSSKIPGAPPATPPPPRALRVGKQKVVDKFYTGRYSLALMSPSSLPTPARVRRQRVHDAVRELLSEQGFRVSMNAVAIRAGCSKQTLYSQFGSKAELLRSVVQEHTDIATARLDDSSDEPREVLLAFAMEHMRRLADPSVVATCQLLSAEAPQFPEEARSLYQEGCATLQQRLANWLQSAMRRGQVKLGDPHFTAELLLSMIVGLDFERQRFAVPHRADEAEQRRWVEFAVDAFLRAFAVTATTPSVFLSCVSKT